MVEYGIESTCDETLKRINRGHTYADTVEAVQRTAACGILTGGHIILRLPEETHDTMLAQAEILSDLPLAPQLYRDGDVLHSQSPDQCIPPPR